MSLPRFEIDSEPYSVVGEPYYASGDYALAFDEKGSRLDGLKSVGATTSFVIDTIQIEVEIETSLCVYVWGYCPIGSWRRTSLPSLISTPGTLRGTCNDPLQLGVSIGIEAMVSATVWFDSSTGWVCVGRPEPDTGSQTVEFAPHTLAVVNEYRLQSVWVQPRNWKSLVAAHRY